jgi:PPOX class probable F420-dependent enzyme
MAPTQQHTRRIKKELRAAGVTRFGMLKFAIKYLPNVVHAGEHIGGVVYGRYSAGTSTLNEGMLVATDRRILFLDHKPGYTGLDEISYDVVAGVMSTSAGFSGVTLHTRLGNYTVRFANRRCADIFTEYVEKQVLEKNHQGSLSKNYSATAPAPAPAKKLDDKVDAFLRKHELGTLSTIDANGKVHGAAVYYLIGNNNLIYVLTKSQTQKAHNTLANPRVALTVYDTDDMQTAQIQGKAEIEPDQSTKDYVFVNLAKPRRYGDKNRYPPVTTIHEGAFMVIRITPTDVKFTDFKITA